MKASSAVRVLVVATFVLVTIVGLHTEAKEPVTLLEMQRILARKKFVDLTYDFAPGIPRWSGFPDEQRKTIYWYDKESGMLGDGFFSEIFTHVGQWGTLVDPPAHFHRGLRTVDQIDPKEMILPLVCVDVHEECTKNPDYTLGVERLKKWELGIRCNHRGDVSQAERWLWFSRVRSCDRAVMIDEKNSR